MYTCMKKNKICENTNMDTKQTPLTSTFSFPGYLTHVTSEWPLSFWSFISDECWLAVQTKYARTKGRRITIFLLFPFSTETLIISLVKRIRNKEWLYYSSVLKAWNETRIVPPLYLYFFHVPDRQSFYITLLTEHGKFYGKFNMTFIVDIYTWERGI